MGTEKNSSPEDENGDLPESGKMVGPFNSSGNGRFVREFKRWIIPREITEERW